MPNQSLTKTAATPQSRLSGSKLALQVLLALSDALPRQNGGKPFSPETLEFMAGGLAELPADALKAAASKALNSCRFMPTVAELREFAGCPAPSAAETVRAEELAAWDAVQAWVTLYRARLRNPTTGHLGWTNATSYGPWCKAPRPIEPLQPRTESALRRVGGPDAIQSAWGTPEEVWLQKRFCEEYRLADAIQDAQRALQAGRGGVRELAEGLAAQLAMGRVQ